MAATEWSGVMNKGKAKSQASKSESSPESNPASKPPKPLDLRLRIRPQSPDVDKGKDNWSDVWLLKVDGAMFQGQLYGEMPTWAAEILAQDLAARGVVIEHEKQAEAQEPAKEPSSLF